MPGTFKTLTETQRAEVETLAAVLSAAQMADYLGIGRTTLFALMERDPDIAERYKRGKARAIGAIAQSLIAKARGGDTASMIFYLKTQAGWREKDRLEVTGAEGGPVEVTSARERLIELLNRHAERTVIEGESSPSSTGPSPHLVRRSGPFADAETDR